MTRGAPVALAIAIAACSAAPARITLLGEGPAMVSVRVSCAGLESGAAYRLKRRSNVRDAKPAWSRTLIAVSGRVEAELSLEAGVHAQFQCVAP